MREDDEAATYVVVDIEADGPTPGANSMLSFAAVALSSSGAFVGEFETVLAPLPGAAPDPNTLAWFATQPEAWAAATTNPRDPAAAIADFVAWGFGFVGRRVFAASPLAFDGFWIDYYLRRFADRPLVPPPHPGPEPLFHGHGLCIRSYAAAALSRPAWRCSAADLPLELLGGEPHTHRAIDDARGYAHLLRYLLQR